MINKLFRENLFPVLFFTSLFIYGLTIDETWITIANHVTATGIITSFVCTTMFFLVPAQFTGVSFAFMFTSIVIRLFMFGIIGSIGFFSIESDMVAAYTIILLITILLYKIPAMFLLANTATEKQV